MDIAAAERVTVRGETGETGETVWVVRLRDGRLGCLAGLHVDGLPSDGQRVSVGGTEDGDPVTGLAEVVRSGRAFDEVHGRLRRKYGVRWRLDQVRRRLARRDLRDPVLLIRLDDTV